MKRNNKLLKLLTMFCAFAMGTSVIVTSFQNKTPTRVEAAQHMDNYASYTYSGSYYSGINFNLSEGMNGALRQAITTLSVPHGFYKYSSQGEDHLATQLQYADEDPTNSNNMVYFYTRDSVTKNPASGWNREHVWPQSLSNNNWGESKGGTDILHLRPTYSNVNSSRGNLKYGDNNKSTAKYYNSMLYGYAPKSATYFEPIDSVKGDAARIIMYMWTTYTGYSGYNALNILDVFQSYDLLLQWHTQDKPDLLEGRRNNYSESSIQQNRNPFVDHPELAWKIFGEKVSSSVKSACQTAYPGNGSTPDPTGDELTGITLNKTTLFLNVGETQTLTASPVPSTADLGTVSWSSSNTSVATVTTSGVVKGISGGTATITARVSSSISAQCTVTVTGSGSSTDENEATIDLSDKSYSVAKPSSAQTSLSTTVVGDYTLNLLNVHNDATGYAYLMFGTKQLSTNKSLLSNKTPAPGPITKIVFNTTSTASTSAVYNAVLSSSEVTSTVASSSHTLTGKGSIEITANASDNLRYFGISCTTSNYNGQIKDIEITYADESATPVDPTAKEVVESLSTKTSLTYNYTKEDSEPVVDTLNNAFTGIGAVTTYTSWQGKTGTSGAVYAGQSAGSNSTIQLRSNNDNSGIITTTSGGFASKIVVSWNSGTSTERVLNIYGKNSAYSSPTDLYDTSKQGTKIGSLSYGTEELVINGSYAYIGIRSNYGALYLDSLSIEWGSSATTFTYTGVGIRFSGFLSTEQWSNLDDDSRIESYGLIFAYDGRNIKNAYTTNKTSNNTIDDAISATCDGTNVIYLNTEITENRTSPRQDGENYVWNLFKKVTEDKLTTEFSAIAFIRTENDIVFLKEVKASAKSIAQEMLNSDDYDNASYEGSLYNLANLQRRRC